MQVLAIDIGTACTKVAYGCRHMKQPELLPIGARGSVRIPSLLYAFPMQEDVVFGDAAAEMLTADAAGVEFLPVRRPGSRVLRVNGHELKPQRLYAGFLRHLLDLANVHLGLSESSAIADVVVTTPSHYGPDEHDTLRAAATAAGITRVMLMEQPVAAIESQRHNGDVWPARVIVLDIGRTVKWALIEMPTDRFDTPQTRLTGSSDSIVDESIERGIYSALSDDLRRAAAPSDLPRSDEFDRHLLERATWLKENLSRLRSDTITVRSHQHELVLHRKELEAIVERVFISPALQRWAEWLESIGPGHEDLPILLCGGSSGLPGVRKALTAMQRRILNPDPHIGMPVLGALRQVLTRRLETADGMEPPRAGHACRHSVAYDIARSAYLADDHQQSLALATPLAQAGHAGSQHLLGVMYAYAKGVPEDPIRAGYWLNEAAQQNYAAAQRELARLFLLGGVLAEDPTRAAELYSKAAAQNDPQACYALAMLYKHGRGVSMDLQQFRKQLERAALLGHDDARLQLEKL